MQYRINPRNGEKISALGLGCMRFPGPPGHPDHKQVRTLIAHAYELGINYFDTAYIYPGNEVALGKFLSKGWRSKVNIATKVPHYKIKTLADLEKIFSEELARLQTNYIDFYLMHMLQTRMEPLTDRKIRFIHW